MGTIFDTAFDAAIVNGVSNLGDYRQILRESDNSDFDATGGASQQKPASDWGRTGSKVAATTATWGTWEAASSGTEAYSLLVRTQDAGGFAYQDFLLFDGGDFPLESSSIETGTDVTVDPGYLECVNEGVAEIVLNGIGNVDYVLLDGSQTEQARIDNQGNWTYDSSNNELKASSDVTFSNNSGSPWTVEEVRVEIAGSSAVVMSDTSISTTVADGGSITFTQIELQMTI